jgi:hypothetical protein
MSLQAYSSVWAGFVAGNEDHGGLRARREGAGGGSEGAAPGQ